MDMIQIPRFIDQPVSGDFKRDCTPAKEKQFLTDAQFIEARRRAEHGGVPCKALAHEFGVTYEYMRGILSYKTRRKLIPPDNEGL